MKILFYKKTFLEIDFISPHKTHISKLIRSFKLIQVFDPLFFQKKIKLLKAVLVYPGNDYYSEVFSRQRIWICQPKTIRESKLTYLASLGVHESWHIVQYLRGVKNIASLAERGAYLKQREFLVKAKDYSSVHWLDKVYKTKWWEDGGDPDTRVSDNQVLMRKKFLEFLKQYQTNQLRIKTI
ncbi:MAG: hypothetical protein AB1721_02345 [Patescibacteria group bacterium]